MSNSKNIEVGKNVIKIEAQAVAAIADRIGNEFDHAVNAILNCKGRLIILGMGKSGLISQKIASTMASTGTPAHFVHPADAFHGDLGMITKEDVVLMVSNSGETHELLEIIPSLKRKAVPTISMVGKENSTLFKNTDYALDTSVEKEACTLDLAPTASTTATLAMGDALAVALLESRGFNAQDFAELHPGGSLGKKLLLKVDQLIHKDNEIPFVHRNTSLKDALLTISEKGLGITGVLDEKDNLIGIITDGDIRRGIEKSGNNIFDKTAEDFMSLNPKTISTDTLAITALETMEKYNITSLFVYSSNDLKKPDGIVHIHDILKTGIK
ncbi:KpsF/GutQ family sugar-phosphate isomerase [Candidatus Marinimicrobia bacterium]|nr:KpsF/GutQ family sugar-phosphate isomerase [Candidatus Neomarinimicrobiota bacterium]